MTNIAILPSNGTRINVGFVTGSNESAQKEVQEQLNDKNHNVKAPSLATGASITFGQDLISVGGNSKSGFEFRAGAEISGGVLTTKKDVKVGERDVWYVTVTEHDWEYDPYYDEYRRDTDVYTHKFYNERDAYNYAIYANSTGSYDREVYASYPQQGIENVYDRSSKTEGSLRLGGTVGVQKNFENVSVRVDGLAGYDFLQKSGYAGGRVSVATNALFGGKPGLGVYAQVDTDISGEYKDTRGQLGVSVSF